MVINFIFATGFLPALKEMMEYYLFHSFTQSLRSFDRHKEEKYAQTIEPATVIAEIIPPADSVNEAAADTYC